MLKNLVIEYIYIHMHISILYASFSDTEELDSEELMLVDDTRRDSEKLGNRGI